MRYKLLSVVGRLGKINEINADSFAVISFLLDNAFIYYTLLTKFYISIDSITWTHLFSKS